MSHLTEPNEDKRTSSSVWPPAVNSESVDAEVTKSLGNGRRLAWHPLDIKVLWACIGLATPLILLVPLRGLQFYLYMITVNNDNNVYHPPTTLDRFESWNYADAFSMTICGVIVFMLFGNLINKNRLTAALFFFAYTVSALLISVFPECFSIQLCFR